MKNEISPAAKKEYIDIAWMRKELVEMLCEGELGGEEESEKVIKIFFALIGRWRKHA